MALTAVSIGLGALVERCRPHVGPNAFLNQEGGRGAEAMLARIMAAAEPRRSSAFAAFARMAAPASTTEADEETAQEADSAGTVETDDTVDPPNEDMVMPVLDPSANPELMGGLVAVMAAAMISSIDSAACTDADALVEALSPLPPENIARLAGAGLGIAGTMRPGSTDSPLCPA